MSYLKHFRLTDDLIADLTPLVTANKSAFLQSRYTGFVSVSAVTVYELAIKDILCNFGNSNHKVLGNFARFHFDRINGRIKYESLCNEYVRRFGEKYRTRFKKNVDLSRRQMLREQGKDIVTSYNNIVLWRHTFAHEGLTPSNATYQDVIDSYELGKSIIECLSKSMHR
jgi:hypothetical protein